jgi:hypothetical protein
MTSRRVVSFVPHHDPQEVFSGPNSHLLANGRCPDAGRPRLRRVEGESALQLPRRRMEQRRRAGRRPVLRSQLLWRCV